MLDDIAVTVSGKIVTLRLGDGVSVTCRIEELSLWSYVPLAFTKFCTMIVTAG